MRRLTAVSGSFHMHTALVSMCLCLQYEVSIKDMIWIGIHNLQNNGYWCQKKGKLGGEGRGVRVGEGFQYWSQNLYAGAVAVKGFQVFKKRHSLRFLRVFQGKWVKMAADVRFLKHRFAWICIFSNSSNSISSCCGRKRGLNLSQFNRLDVDSTFLFRFTGLFIVRDFSYKNY